MMHKVVNTTESTSSTIIQLVEEMMDMVLEVEEDVSLEEEEEEINMVATKDMVSKIKVAETFDMVEEMEEIASV